MRLRADVHCYHCGQISGSWEWQSTATPEHGIFQELGDQGRRTVCTLAGMRCVRCGGPIFLDEVETVPERPQITFERPRRGRPPKSAQRLAS
jgi:hypothetical protein